MADQPTGWLTEQQFLACLAAKGGQDISEHQLERWRGEGVLPSVRQDPLKYHGSKIYYPVGYCEQAIAVRDLLLKKRKFDYVGWELWWRGFPVNEKHWKPHLLKTATTLDKGLKHLHLLIKKDKKSESKRTIYDQTVQLKASNIILSRIYKRVQIQNLATVFRVILEVADGHFEGFEAPSSDNVQSHDVIETVKALDIGDSGKDKIASQKLNLIGVLVPMLRDISESLCGVKLADELQRPDTELDDARDDVRNTLRLAQAFYGATRWIYGPTAFGLRFAEWISKKADRRFRAVLVLLFSCLRKISNDLLPSAEIKRLADEAESVLDSSRKLEALFSQDRRFKFVLKPKRLRFALEDKFSARQLLREIENARIN